MMDFARQELMSLALLETSAVSLLLDTVNADAMAA
jgi:hypothetical protein